MSEQINDGGSALPTADAYHPSGQIAYGRKGMTLRDWFAGQALAGLLSEPKATLEPPDRYAKAAYIMADAMLKARGGAK